MLRDPIAQPVRGDVWQFAEHGLTVAAVSDFQVVLWHDLSGEFVTYDRVAREEASQEPWETAAKKWTFFAAIAKGFDAWWEELPAILTADNRKLARLAFDAGEMRGIVRTMRLSTEPVSDEGEPRFLSMDLDLMRRQRDKLMDMSEIWLESAQECNGTGEKDLERGFMKAHAIFVRACNDLTAYICGREPASEKRRADARRWNAFLNCARIRILGWTGLDEVLKVRQDRQFTVHFGAEFWTRFLLHGPDEEASTVEANKIARKVVTAFADAAVAIEDGKLEGEAVDADRKAAQS